MESKISLSQKQLSEFLLHVAVVRPVFIWGPPGIGKSSLVSQFAESVGLPCVSLLGSQLAPEDIIGVPQIVDGKSRFCDRNGKWIFTTGGSLHDPDFKGLSAESIYDRIVTDIRRFRKIATLRGVGICQAKQKASLNPRHPKTEMDTCTWSYGWKTVWRHSGYIT